MTETTNHTEPYNLADGSRLVRLTVELEMTEYQRERLNLNVLTDATGGRIAHLDWEGGVFAALDFFQSWIAPGQGGFIFSRQDNKDFMNLLADAVQEGIKDAIHTQLALENDAARQQPSQEKHDDVPY